MEIPPTPVTLGEAIDARCPMPSDMLEMLVAHAPEVLANSREVLESETGLVF
eukprot:CAMPEP_0185782978 /NCGR_PEP_ID=MMETSP1174-20130828/113257_1 /TAXON_ID=35687 /ORGANISM="Dictyocha speculum, Strain CCMP1381" /LENGTH=51 /DNA_ID=CAMNT_0028473747 /DNA_START=197 /DNA_END=352 /DNA_ORIENTATION=-